MNAPDQAWPGVITQDFKPISGTGALVGFVDVHVPAWRLRLFGCTVFDNGSRRWVSLPGMPQLGRDKRALTDTNGKGAYSPTAAFDDKGTSDRFSEAVIAALLAHAPGAFDRGSR
jgi:hypothetical protein